MLLVFLFIILAFLRVEEKKDEKWKIVVVVVVVVVVASRFDAKGQGLVGGIPECG